MVREGGLRKEGIFKKGTPSRPLVSIITPTFNRRETLLHTMESVLHQTYSPVEYIVVDGGSQDGTVELLERYSDRIDYWVSERDEGVFDAMNKGVRLSRGEIIGIINSDDWYAPDTVEKVVENWKEDPRLNVFFGDAVVILKGERFAFLRKGSFERFPYEMSLNHPTCFLTRDTYQRWGYFDTRFRYAADYEFFLRIYFAGAKFKYIPSTLAYVRKGGLTESYGVHLEVYQIYLRYFSFPFAFLRFIQESGEHFLEYIRRNLGESLAGILGEERWQGMRERWLRRKFGANLLSWRDYPSSFRINRADFP